MKSIIRAFFKYFWLPIYRRWALKQIAKERTFVSAGLRLSVPPGVFHPGIFFSSPIFASFLQNIDLQNKKVVDVGTGTGILALFVAKKGAIVTALDIHPLAVETARLNAQSNGFPLTSTLQIPSPTNNPITSKPITILESDLFDRLPPQVFDFVLVNPPYYSRAPRDFAEHAFFAGENLEYFEKLFGQLGEYSTPQTRVLMILSEDCPYLKIQEIAARNGFLLHIVFEKKKWGERFFVAQADSVAQT